MFFPLIREFKPDLIIVSAGFDSAKGDPLGQVAVSPVGYAWMTQGLRQIQNCIAVVLEGGYSLEALEVSSEAVVKVLKTSPKDPDAFDEIVASYGYENEETGGKGAYEELKKQALLFPRYSFRVTMSSIAKLIKKTWGSVVEDLIFEKPRRKSSAQSKKSSGSKSENQDHATSSTPLGLRNRLNSMDD